MRSVSHHWDTTCPAASPVVDPSSGLVKLVNVVECRPCRPRQFYHDKVVTVTPYGRLGSPINAAALETVERSRVELREQQKSWKVWQGW